MEVHIQRLSKLTRLEEHLTTLLEKIDQEIIQTDIEWLHLKSVVENQNKSSATTPADGASNESNDSKSKSIGGRLNIKVEADFDAVPSNSELRLDPNTNNVRKDGEEFDSD